MGDSAEQNRRYDDVPGEITVKTQAAINVVQMAKSLGFFERLADLMSGCCGKMPKNATDSSRPGERRKKSWRGEEDQEKVTVSEDLTNTDNDGESRYWDQKAIEGLKALEKKRRRRKLQQDIEECSQGD
jgi:hypothetical protein